VLEPDPGPERRVVHHHGQARASQHGSGADVHDQYALSCFLAIILSSMQPSSSSRTTATRGPLRTTTVAGPRRNPTSWVMCRGSTKTRVYGVFFSFSGNTMENYQSFSGAAAAYWHQGFDIRGEALQECHSPVDGEIVQLVKVTVILYLN